MAEKDGHAPAAAWRGSGEGRTSDGEAQEEAITGECCGREEERREEAGEEAEKGRGWDDAG